LHSKHGKITNNIKNTAVTYKYNMQLNSNKTF